ncbi:MAG TPA: hypothetical protein VIR58_04420 [Acidimicrobiales bacterium]
MDLWYPPNDQPHLLEWWRPLLLASRAARVERFPWPLHIDEVQLVGRVDRGSRGAIWVYRHSESRGEIYIDATGQTYKYTRTPNAKSHGRFNACPVRDALWRAALPTVVEPIWYDDPSPALANRGWADEAYDAHDEADGDGAAPGTEPRRTSAPRRRGHLTVLDGGRSLAG